MTSLPVHIACQYLTAGGKWRDADYRALAIVKSVKGEPFNGYCTVKVNGRAVNLTKDNMDVGLELAARTLAARLVELTQVQVSLVPIPNSHAHIGVPPIFRTLALAEAIARYSNGIAEACPALLWAAPKDKQHLVGGYRSASQFHAQLRITKSLSRPVVLIDDVITSGSQMLAATYALRKADVTVPFGMAVGRTTTEQRPQVLQWSEETLTQHIL